MKVSRTNVRFLTETGHISKTVRDTAKVILLIINRKWHTLCQIRWKSLTLYDLEGH